MSRKGQFQRKEVKICPDCKRELEREEFRYGGQIRRHCKVCFPEQSRKYRAEHKEDILRWHRERNARNPQAHRQRQKDILARYRKTVLEHYGGSPPKCACCGESHYEFLALDHTDGGGEKHRKEHTNGIGGLKTYRWAIKNGFPKIFRVLCHNCNSSLGYYGYCPHQT